MIFFEVGMFGGIAALLAWALHHTAGSDWFGIWCFFMAAALLLGWLA